MLGSFTGISSIELTTLWVIDANKRGSMTGLRIRDGWLIAHDLDIGFSAHYHWFPSQALISRVTGGGHGVPEEPGTALALAHIQTSHFIERQSPLIANSWSRTTWFTCEWSSGETNYCSVQKESTKILDILTYQLVSLKIGDIWLTNFACGVLRWDDPPCSMCKFRRVCLPLALCTWVRCSSKRTHRLYVYHYAMCTSYKSPHSCFSQHTGLVPSSTGPFAVQHMVRTKDEMSEYLFQLHLSPRVRKSGSIGCCTASGTDVAACYADTVCTRDRVLWFLAFV